ncbi:GNAT family N-acetyltransferase [Allokutzneria albata]|uniref:Protein N-acetyltransferase, RimJ/RimL family n=1 Tax=Allokutzneria albata TaxID=211114 RepID=A0A1G9TSA0_ALLAB|nr:GNAT family N-acetyltransferase [Allokutzneria albata]SDM50593.1 Protein N-acetyltransferase, RimJ/RimL family [Allokutzneria albata]
MITQLSGVTGAKVRLRAVAPADGRTLRGFDRDATRVGGYRHWAAHRADSGGEDVQFAIETLRSRMLVGSMWTVPAGDRFSYGIGIGAQHRRCGYAGDAITALLGFMFERCGYDSCEVSIHGGNMASLSLHAILGFREEDRLRDTEVLRGRINYLVLMRITAAEFSAPKTTSHRGRHCRPRRGRHWQAS